MLAIRILVDPMLSVETEYVLVYQITKEILMWLAAWNVWYTMIARKTECVCETDVKTHVQEHVAVVLYVTWSIIYRYVTAHEIRPEMHLHHVLL